MLDRHLEPFLSHLEIVRHLSPHTINSYKRDLSSFFSFLKEKKDSWEEIQDHQVREFVASERRSGLNPRSLQRMLSSIRSFFNYLLDEELIDTNPATDISSPKSAQLLPRLWILIWLKDFWILSHKEILKSVTRLCLNYYIRQD